MKEKTITQLGSNWNNWSNAGTFYWNLNNSVSNRNRNIRGHLIFAKKHSRMSCPAIFMYMFFQPCHSTKQKNKRCMTTPKENTALLIKNKEMSTVSTG
nr:MAG TPA: hypothetical protein [Caudoviricetes sp.]